MNRSFDTNTPDALTIAVYAAQQIPFSSTFDANDGLTMTFDVRWAINEFVGWMVEATDLEVLPTPERKQTMSKAQTIIAEMRAADAAHAARNAARLAEGTMPSLPRERYALATASGRADAQGTANLLLKGTDDIRNGQRRDFSLPRRAMSMAASRGRVKPDMLTAVMAYFQSPTDMAQSLLAGFLPAALTLAEAKAIVAQKATDEGWGESATTALMRDLPTILKSLNPSRSHNGRASARVHIYKPGVAPTVDPKRRGRPSGPKYVAYLPPVAERDLRPIYGPCEPGIPGGNDVAHGPVREGQVRK